MEPHFTSAAPCVNLYDVETYDESANQGVSIPDETRRQKYLNARKSVVIDIDKFYYWLFRAEWDCKLSLKGVVTSGQELFDGSPEIQNYYTTSVRSVEKVGVAQHGRDRKIIVADSRGRSVLMDDTTNPLPAGYPKNILYNIRSNPCFKTNGSTVYFDVIYRVENFVFEIRGQDQPPPTPNYGPLFYDVSIQRRAYGNYLYFYSVSYGYSAPFQCEIYFTNDASSDTAYDYERKKYIPDISFGYFGPIDWVGINPLNETSGAKTRLSVDGLTIPSGTGLPDQPDVTVEWKVEKERDL